MEFSQKLRTCLWFANEAEEAAEFYVSLLPDSHIEKVWRPGGDGPALVVEFILAGAPFMTLNGAQGANFTPAASISVLTKDQDETDRLWNALLADGGEEMMCGWIADRYGVSWQVVPEVMARLINSDDGEAASRAQQAMYAMRKIDIGTIEAAYRGN